MASAISSAEAGLNQINQWLAALASGENARTIVNSHSMSLSGVGNEIQLGAITANALRMVSDFTGGIGGLGGGLAIFQADVQQAQADYQKSGSVQRTPHRTMSQNT